MTLEVTQSGEDSDGCLLLQSVVTNPDDLRWLQLELSSRKRSLMAAGNQEAS